MAGSESGLRTFRSRSALTHLSGAAFIAAALLLWLRFGLLPELHGQPAAIPIACFASPLLLAAGAAQLCARSRTGKFALPALAQAGRLRAETAQLPPDCLLASAALSTAGECELFTRSLRDAAHTALTSSEPELAAASLTLISQACDVASLKQVERLLTSPTGAPEHTRTRALAVAVAAKLATARQTAHDRRRLVRAASATVDSELLRCGDSSRE